MKRKLSQKPVNIDAGLFEELEEFLSTDYAKRLGYHSKAQFVTETVSDRLEKYSERLDRVMINNLYRAFRENLNKYELKANHQELYAEFMEHLIKKTNFDLRLVKKSKKTK